MIELSSEFRGLTSKIYTFVFLSLSVKLLKITSISQSGTKVEFENSDIVAGALAIVALFLTISAIFKLLSDIARTRVIDEVFDTEITGFTPSELKASPNRQPTFSEVHFNFIRFTSLVSFVIESLLPLLLGALVSLYMWQDMVEFLYGLAK